MTAQQALAFCATSHYEVDGDSVVSQSVYDCDGNPHWIKWPIIKNRCISPRLCSGAMAAFSEAFAPFTQQQKDKQ